MKKMIIGVGVGAIAYYLLLKFAVKTSAEDSGFIMASDGFGLDDLVVGGGSYLAGALAADMVSKAG